MVEKELGSPGGLNNLQERRNTISGTFGDQRGAKVSQIGIKVSQALFEPPPRDPSRVVLTFFLRSPNEDRNHSTCSHSCSQCRVILHPQISPEPHYAASTTGHLSTKKISPTPQPQELVYYCYCCYYYSRIHIQPLC